MIKKVFFGAAAVAALLIFSAGSGDKEYKYETVPNDPLHGRIYHLDNGLTVFLTVNKAQPRIQTMIATKAGSKYDPHDATGLAHYLEHMLFKGTDKYGTKDYAKEKPLLDSIENLFEVYRKTTDTTERKKIYHHIDTLSYQASGYAIANEYDKMMTSIGAKGTNAFTSVEETVFIEDIPSNEMEQYLQIESERFRNPVMRLFHTELEAVYEEKNRGLDNDYEKTDEALMSGLFRKHPYGTQTTIGTIHDLKNPSLKNIIEYYHTYYVPDNMVIAMSGDLDPDATIKLIDKYFGGFTSKPVPAYTPPQEDPIKSPIEKNVNGPEAANVTIGYRFAGAGSDDADMISLISQMLSNYQAGLFDIDLTQQQKVLNAAAYSNVMKDYSVMEMQAYPVEGQTLKDAQAKMQGELDKLKTGDFPDWLISAVVNNMRLQETQQYHDNFPRAYAFTQAFVTGESWEHAVGQTDRLSKITKQQVMDFAKKNFTDDYVVVYKNEGTDTTVEKVTKPKITPVQTNAEDESPFVKNIEAEPVTPLTPVYLDFSKDVKKYSVKNEMPVYYAQNNEDSTFSMYILFDMSAKRNKMLKPALDYLQFAGTSTMSAAQVQQEFYKLACTYFTYAGTDQTYVGLSGLTKNFVPAMKLLESLLSDVQPDEDALKNTVSSTMKDRENEELDKNTILFSAMYDYGIYGKHSPFCNVLTNKELKNVKAKELTDLIHDLCNYPHHVLYYGSEPGQALVNDLGTLHKMPAQFKPLPQADTFVQLKGTNQVYIIDHDMKQAEIIILQQGGYYDPAIKPQAALYNEYFGGSMASIVFQTLRESKALAYSTFCSYYAPSDTTEHYYNLAYIGSQVDKLPEAVDGMMDLLNNDMPQYPQLWSSSRDAILKSIASTRIIR
ncbi:MAG TPA: insulinase family protein, partial [Bacteroidia bacterium]|nr:insulinase family protein [Bacteroidia bacterium]